MVLQTSGAISLLDVQNEFGGSNPIGINEYYNAASGIPASGTISLSNFYGTSAIPPLWSNATLTYSIPDPNAYGSASADQFGFSVGISGDYAIVGAGREDASGATDTGKAYIFNIVTGSLVHTLSNPNVYGTGASDLFGYSVAISGNYAIVSAYLEDDAGGTSSGVVYVFNVTTGALLRTIYNPNDYGTSAGDVFGLSLALDGNYAIISSYVESTASYVSAGVVYIFNVTTGALLHTIANPNAAGTPSYDSFGLKVAIKGNYAIVGASQEDVGGSGSGIAYIFNVTTGALVHTLNNPNAYSTVTYDNFGLTVAIDTDYALVATPQEDDAGGSSSGAAYIFSVATGALVRTITNPNVYGTSASDVFGKGGAITGEIAIIGASGEDDGGSSSGTVYVFNVTTGALLHTISDPNAYGTATSDTFGEFIMAEGNNAIVGAPYEDSSGASSSGWVYIFSGA